MGTECHYFICDVGNREEVYQTAKAVREKARGDCPGLGGGGGVCGELSSGTGPCHMSVWVFVCIGGSCVSVYLVFLHINMCESVSVCICVSVSV